nr:MAG TPA: hypothetical protein [Caudoviricetes sp.]
MISLATLAPPFVSDFSGELSPPCEWGSTPRPAKVSEILLRKILKF